MKRLTFVAAVVLLIGLGPSAPPARADLLFDLEQVGPNVVVTVSGSLSTFLDNLANAGHAPVSPGLTAYYGDLIVGPTTTSETLWQGFRFIGPDWTLGPGRAFSPSHNAGPDTVGITFSGADFENGLYLPSGYTDFSMLSSRDTYDNVSLTDTSFNNLGFTPGDYFLYSDYDAIRVHVAPEPASLTLLGLGAAGLLGYRRPRERTKEATPHFALRGQI